MLLYGLLGQHPRRKEVIAFFLFFFFDAFADRLKSAMQEQNMDAKTLAYLAGVATITVERWLNSIYEPRHKNLRAVTRALGVSAEYLCGKES